MKLSEWAKKNGITYRTAWQWFKAGKLPVPAVQMPTGTILIQEGGKHEGKVALYARVSSADQKSDLDRQVSRLLTYANEQGWDVGEAVTEIGSGLNGRRPKLMKLLADPKVKVIVVEHRDRLMRFGFEYVESALVAQGRRIVVVDQSELKDDLVQDMIEVLTSFCARLYGRRSAANKAKKAMEAMQCED
ncbi:resolvase, n terminal domain [Heliomicrobium modesticaldum Ice1]|uniref:Resolvase, n terminal domain n=1 Tax=Heliobacterium modesticaldum (strain ATCC 51547 / Ice1) TaxID=498761 RepID=B0TCK0_HELMI|nr:IS607 family transposase [Heliomicrobium modesticaldum]ABZ84026.1 resolvase, n terminal domain [Heliomicrobium modesticaldum Ice1]